MLHIVNKSSFERNSLQSCTNLIDDKSIVLLIEDGVISAANHTKSVLVADLASDGRLYALQADIDAKGLSTKLISNVKTVDYVGFVDLVVEHGTPVSWV